MTRRQADVLAVLDGWRLHPRRDQTARQVADKLGITRDAALSRLKALERNGYVRCWCPQPGVMVWYRL